MLEIKIKGKIEKFYLSEELKLEPCIIALDIKENLNIKKVSMKEIRKIINLIIAAYENNFSYDEFIKGISGKYLFEVALKQLAKISKMLNINYENFETNNLELEIKGKNQLFLLPSDFSAETVLKAMEIREEINLEKICFSDVIKTIEFIIAAYENKFDYNQFIKGISAKEFFGKSFFIIKTITASINNMAKELIDDEGESKAD